MYISIERVVIGSMALLFLSWLCLTGYKLTSRLLIVCVYYVKYGAIFAVPEAFISVLVVCRISLGVRWSRLFFPLSFFFIFFFWGVSLIYPSLCHVNQDASRPFDLKNPRGQPRYSACDTVSTTLLLFIPRSKKKKDEWMIYSSGFIDSSEYTCTVQYMHVGV